MKIMLYYFMANATMIIKIVTLIVMIYTIIRLNKNKENNSKINKSKELRKAFIYFTAIDTISAICLMVNPLMGRINIVLETIAWLSFSFTLMIITIYFWSNSKVGKQGN